MNPHAVVDFRCLEEFPCSLVNQVTRVSGQAGLAASQLDSLIGALKRQPIEKTDRVYYSLQLMEAIDSLAENVQQQINFARRWFFQLH